VTSAPLTLTGNEVISIQVISENILVHLCSVRQTVSFGINVNAFLQGPLVRWLKVNFSECFCAWIHVKALRVFVESVLRLVEYIIYNAFLCVKGS